MKKYAQHFITAERYDGNTFIKLDNPPQELLRFMAYLHEEHFNGCLHNDWIYATAAEAFETLEDENTARFSIEADCYAKDLREWFTKPFAANYCNAAMEHYRYIKDIYEIIRLGQIRAKENIYSSVERFLSEEQEEEE